MHALSPPSLFQEAMISKLQQKHEAEKLSRGKAQRALADRAEALVSCNNQRRVLEKEVVQCTRDLHALKAAGSEGDGGGGGSSSAGSAGSGSAETPQHHVASQQQQQQPSHQDTF